MNALLKISFSFAVAIGLCSGLNATQFPVPSECPYADAEVSTNLSFAALNRSEILEGWADAPPRFLFNPEWNMMRITARRMDGARLIVSDSYRFAPLIIHIR